MIRYLRAAPLMAAVLTAACSGGHDVTQPPPPAGKPTLSLRDTLLLSDETAPVGFTARDDKGNSVSVSTIAWSSSAPAVASVDGAGHVTAGEPGTAVITATMPGAAATATITVKPQFTQIGPGESHTCGITGRGEVYCWGTSYVGALGTQSGSLVCPRLDPNARCTAVPVRALSLHATQVVGGGMQSCALDEGGAAWCWGGNWSGETGTGSTAESVPTPTQVAGGLRFRSLVAGRTHTCGITTSGDAYCWGWDHAGQLGGGDVSSDRCTAFWPSPCSRTPRLVAGGHQWKELAATDRATCGVTTAGELFCWGLDVGGSDGLFCQVDGNYEGCVRTPIRVSAGKVFAHVAIGNVHRCEQAADGRLECWGADYWGAFGNGSTGYTLTPVVAAGNAAYAAVVAYRTGTCGLLADGRAQCWGEGTGGQVGSGKLENAVAPTDVAGGHRFAALFGSGNSDHVCGTDTAGRAYCWGSGTFGQLGDGRFDVQATPVQVQRPAS